MSTTEIAEVLINFLNEIGIRTKLGEVSVQTDLPGVALKDGSLIVDIDKLLYPGDLLHAAGHIAVQPPHEEKKLECKSDHNPAEEMAAMAWSYAAVVKLQLSPELVFHESGYKGQSQQLVQGFRTGMWVGVPLLQYYGMTLDLQAAAQQNEPPFPKMKRWLREV